MATMEEPATKWFDESNDDLIRELLDNESPFFVLPPTFESGENHSSEPVTNHLSEPATQDAESVLSATSSNNESMDQSNIFQARVSVLEEKVTSRIDNKYTLKIKSCGTEMADDGYKWRKYGQKSIKNSPHPRSYYRCTNPRCSAKKQVERSSLDPDTLVVTYEGLHLHFTYTHFLLNQPHPHPHLTHQPTKKAKTNTKGNQSPQIHKTIDSLSPQTHETVTQEIPALFDPTPLNTNMSGLQEELWEVGPQGLLEDMVPLIIRKPSNIITLSNSSSSSSYSSSPPTSSSTLTWSSNNSNPW